MSAQRRPQQSQPRPFKLSLKALLLLPYRICNPPPAVGKVRSFGVTPIFDVQLDDVLDRKHLPPLGLKDFEEWLLYVEHCPENLYFVLWLREYQLKYSQWALKAKPPRTSAGEYRVSCLPSSQSSSQLAMFYNRAKQTFFTPNSNYELNVPSDILSPFHTSKDALPHPDPAVFRELEEEVRGMLQDSLERFVRAAYHNVGTNRVLCGFVGGTVIGILGGVVPLLISIFRWHSRWLRLAALPGLWLGLTILVASFHGLCLMVWVAGDVRQLRKFELSRPPISRPRPVPKPVPVACPRPAQLSIRTQSISAPPRAPILPVAHPPRVAILTPPTPTHVHVSRVRTTSTSSASSYASSSSSSSSSGSSFSGEIHISPAYYDDGPADTARGGPAPQAGFVFPGKPRAARADVDAFIPTASFIHPFAYSDDEDEDADVDADAAARERDPARLQRVSSFDFDALPPRPPPLPSAAAPRATFAPAPRPAFAPRPATTFVPVPRPATAFVPAPKPVPAPAPASPAPELPRILRQDVITIAPEKLDVRFTARALLARLQARCNIYKWRVGTVDPEKAGADAAAAFAAAEKAQLGAYVEKAYGGTEKAPLGAFAEKASAPALARRRAWHGAAPTVRTQFKLVKAVPAFASPLTLVLSPVVRRAQWEIVARSAVVGLVLAWVLLGGLLAVPVVP